MIRAARPADADRIADIHIASWQAAYAGLLPADFLEGLSDGRDRRAAGWADLLAAQDDDRRVLVIVQDEAVVGFAHAGPAGDDDIKGFGELYAMYLDPGYYRKGLGSELMAAVFEEMRSAGYEDAALWVMTDNDAARSFYEKHGWSADGKATDICLGIDIPAVRYRTTL